MPANASGTAPARLASGLLSGLAATAVMTVAFGIGQLVGAVDRLPPRLIVDRLLPVLPQQARGPVAGILHLSYGAVGGAVYTALTPPAARGPVSGSLFGLAIWACGYEGWVPAVGVLPLAHRDRRGRAVVILLAHVVYGAALGVVARRAAAGSGPER